MQVLEWRLMIMVWVKMVVNGSRGAAFRMAFDDNGVGENGSKWL